MADFNGIKNGNAYLNCKDSTARSSISTIEGKIPSSASASNKLATASDLASKVSTSAVGVNNGVASLDSTGKVPSSQLPSFVDDVLEYANQSSFPSTGETGKIYIAKDTNKTYRWSGSAYVEISESLALGETSSTAYAGNKGKANADAISALQTSKANVSDLATVATSGSYNDLNNKPSIPAAVAVKGNAETNYRTGNVNITPANIGLGNVGNFKAVSTVASQGLTDTEKSNARTNIGAGTSSFSGNYNDLSNKPTIPSYGVVSKTANGLAPQLPNETTTTKYLRQDGTWQVPPTTDSNAYHTNDTAETTLADDDKVPFYDTSASGKRNSTWSNIKAKLKSYFDTFYTGNTGTVTSVVTGAGLTGGTITGSGTIKAKLQSETKSSLTAATRFATENREYAVGLDASGNLSVNVPWEEPVKRIILTNDSSTTLYYEIYTYEGYDETCPLWISGTLGTYANAGAAFPFCISVDIEQGKIKGFVSSGLPSSLDILVRRTTNTTVVCVALGLQWSKADLLVKTPTQGTLDTNPTPRSAYSFTINDRLSNLAKLPTTTLEQSATLSTTTTTTVTFSDSSINTDSIIEVFAGRSTGDVSGSQNSFPYESIYTTSGSCAVTFPKFSSAISVKVRIYIR